MSMQFAEKLTNFAVLVFSIVTAFLLAELLVRTYCPQVTGPCEWSFNPELGLIAVPNQHGKRSFPGLFEYHCSNNSIGLRGSKEYLDHHDGIRILLLGDSITYGLGVNDDQTFAFLAERKLTNLIKNIEIINAGITGTGTDYALRFYNYLGWKFHSQIVVLCFYPNDFQDNEKGRSYKVNADGTICPAHIGTHGRLNNILAESKLYNWLKTRSHAFNLLKLTLSDIIGMTLLSNEWHAAGYNWHEGGYSDEGNAKKTKIIIRKLKNELAKKNSAFYIMYIPDRQDAEYYSHNGSISKDEISIYALTQDLGIDLISLTSRLSQEKDFDRIYFPNDGHLTPTGHKIVASVLAPFLFQAIEKLPATSPANYGP